MDDWIAETLHPAWQQRFRVDRILYREKTDLQDLVIFENDTYGRVMMLDGVTQLTERDEFVYHEMIVHVPLFGHGAARRVLIIGGGDGGTLREVLRHKTVEKATMVEIDGTVVDMSKTHLPSLSAGAFDDPRADLVIADGIAFMAEAGESYDVIIVDSTDPFGPAEGLFTPEFYANCKKRLTPGGILVVQAGVPFLQDRELSHVQGALCQAFPDPAFYVITVPTYVGGMMTLGWACETAGQGLPDPTVLARRVADSGLSFRYYTPQIHAAAFALPAFIENLRAGQAPTA